MRYGSSVQLHGTSIAVTGATGFLGRYLVDTLLARGARVVAVVRSPDKARALSARGVEVRRADLAEPDALTAGFRGVHAVIANAAVVSFTKPEQTMRTNIEGTRHVFDAMLRAGVGRAIAVSSSAAYPATPFRLDEKTPLRPGHTPGFLQAYPESKAGAERIAWRLAEEHGIALTTVRPCAITGPDDPLLMRALARLSKLPIAPVPVFTTIGCAHAADVAEAIARCLEKPALTRGKAYNLQGSTTSLWQLSSAWKRAGGRPPWLRIAVPLPYALRFDDGLARRELGWAPRGTQAILDEAVRVRNAG